MPPPPVHAPIAPSNQPRASLGADVADVLLKHLRPRQQAALLGLQLVRSVIAEIERLPSLAPEDVAGLLRRADLCKPEVVAQALREVFDRRPGHALTQLQAALELLAHQDVRLARWAFAVLDALA